MTTLIEKYGGTVRTSAEVTKIVVRNGVAEGVEQHFSGSIKT